MRAEYGVMVSRPKLAIDFHAVEEKHWGIHARLENWARWSRDKESRMSAPMFRLYRASDARREYGSVTDTAIDAMDAQTLAKGVAALPSSNRLAVCWCYLKPINPRRAAQNIGTTLPGLYEHVRNGRQMLLNRCV